MATATIKFFPLPVKKSKKTGLTPIYFRITLNSRKTEGKLNLKVNQNELLLWNEKTMRFDIKHSSIFNSEITKLESKFLDFTRDYAAELDSYTANQIKEKITCKKIKNLPVFSEYIKNYFYNNLLPKNEYAKSTVKNYIKMFNHVDTFLEYKKCKDLLLSKFKKDKAEEFILYLKADLPKVFIKSQKEGYVKKLIAKKKMQDPSANTVIKCLKATLGEAINDSELLGVNPFFGKKLKKKSPPLCER